MKACTILSVASMAVTALAVPFFNTAKSVERRDVGDVIAQIDEALVQKLGLDEIVEGVSGGVAKREVQEVVIETTAQLTQVLKGVLVTVEKQSTVITTALEKVQAGELTKAQGRKVATNQMNRMQFELSEVVSELVAAAGLTIREGDLNQLLTVVVALVSIVLANVKAIVTILGISPQLNSVLASVISIVTDLLIAVTGLVAVLVPSLVVALSPILAGLGNGLLAPLLTPIAALLAGLALPL